MRHLPVICTSALLLAACGGDGPPAGAAGAGTDAGARSAAQSTIDHHTSRDSLDWPGTYHGITPCADCAGIDTTITLAADGTYERRLDYLGNSDAFVDAGPFSWDEAGTTVTLGAPEAMQQRYQVGENVLFQLDRDGHRIEGDLASMYQLRKTIRDARLEDRRWVLVELGGEPVTPAADDLEAFIVFSSDDGRASGNNSCNAFFGPYLLEPSNRIVFPRRMGTTMRACREGSREAAFMSALLESQRYSIADGVLSLQPADGAPAARFRESATPLPD